MYLDICPSQDLNSHSRAKPAKEPGRGHISCSQCQARALRTSLLTGSPQWTAPFLDCEVIPPNLPHTHNLFILLYIIYIYLYCSHVKLGYKCQLYFKI